MSEALRGHERRSGPVPSDRRSIGPWHVAVVAVVEHQQRRRLRAREPRDVEVLPARPQPLLRARSHERHHLARQPEPRAEALRPVARASGRPHEHGALELQTLRERSQRRRGPERMRDQRVRPALLGGDSAQRPREMHDRAAPAFGQAVAGGVECHDSIAVRQKRLAEVGELTANARPAMDEVDVRPAAPRPAGHALSLDAHVETPTRREESAHAPRVAAAARREEEVERPVGRAAGR